MGRAKEIIVKVIPAKIANPFVQKHHYSGKVVQNSSLHFGAFLDGKLHGVLSYGPSMDKKKILPLVEGTEWNGCIELNRMAFDDYLPKNSESYCIAKTLRMIKKQAPQVKWVVSFADGAQCGDGTIYRASNFVLTGIKKNNSMWRLPDGRVICPLVLNPGFSQAVDAGIKKELGKVGEYASWSSIRFLKHIGAKPIPGFQLRYIYFIDPKWRKRLTVPEIPFSKIDEMGAGMYKGENVTQESRHVKCEAQLEREAKKQETNNV
jgi:hypothetical protein